MEENQRRNYTSLILALSIIINVALAAYSTYDLRQTADLRNQIEEITESYSSLSEAYTSLADTSRSLEQQLNITTTQLKYYKDLAEYYSNLTTTDGETTSVRGEATIPIVATYQIGSWYQSELRGVVMGADVELRDGEGRVLVDTVPRIGIDIQTSVRTAVMVAEEATGVSLSGTDVILTITSDQESDVVDGPSAGGAITVALISALNNETLVDGSLMTGTINSDGSIGPVGGIPEKALAAAEKGCERFYVPRGQSNIIVYVPKVTHPLPGWSVRTYERKLMSLQDYLQEEGYIIIVEEVGSIEEAYSKFTQ